MIYTTTLTQKGQATIPAEIRRFLGIKPHEKICFVKKGKEVIIKPSKTFIHLKGSIKNRIKYCEKQANEKLSQFIAENYDK